MEKITYSSRQYLSINKKNNNWVGTNIIYTSFEYFGNILSIFVVYKYYKHHISNVSTEQGSPNYGSRLNFNRLAAPIGW